MAPQQRERYNSKARGSTAGASSHKKRTRTPGSMTGVVAVAPGASGASGASGTGEGMDVIVPKTKEEKEQDRKSKLKAEMVAASETKMSSKKKKRLDGFINKKLKKEARAELFASLEASQNTVPKHLLASLASSSTLGSGTLLSYAAKAAKEEDKNVRRALTRTNKRRKTANPEDPSDDEDEEDWETGNAGDVVPRPTFDQDEEEEEESRPGMSGVAGVEKAGKPAETAPVAVGGALKRREDGSVGIAKYVPLKKDNKGKGKALPGGGWKEPSGYFPAENEDSEDSFDSSDSENDSNEMEGMSGDDDDQDGTDGSEGSGEDEESEEEDKEPVGLPGRKRKRAGGFKDWALKQIETVYKGDGADPSPSNATPSISYDDPMPFTSPGDVDQSAPSNISQLPAHHKPIKLPPPTSKIGPLGTPYVMPSRSLLQPSTVSTPASSSSTNKNRIAIERDPMIQENRLKLPVVAEEQEIVETILMNPVTVLCGETGSGKTTQVPQFLFEAGFGTPGSDNPGMIGITQPRRVAAMSMASRVASELSLPPSRISYQIRYDATVSPQTSIKFMTDGVLLRELAKDFLLNKYSVVIVDEAHERSVNTDVLIGVLSRVSKLREDLWRKGKDGIKPLRIVIMSATLRVTDFTLNTTLFPSPPPVIEITTRQHPVTVHFNRRTTNDYLGEAYKKVAKIHARLPPGGILVFLTGQGEIQGLCRKLEKKFGKKAIEERNKRREKERERAGGWRSQMGGLEKMDRDKPERVEQDMKVVSNDADIEIEELEFGLDEPGLADDVDDGADSDPEALDSDSGEEDEIVMNEGDEADLPLHILPLYSLLPSDKQMRVFADPPEGTRLVVVATNVAETSLTIPGIKYVVDCGRAKERHYDAKSGVQSFQISWISKASAAQRAGRAGRTGPGHCYRLYSSPVFENYFEKFAKPEILRMPIEGIVLQMKSMNIDAVINFPFPTPPDRTNLTKAERILTLLGALEPPEKGKMINGIVRQGSVGGKITELGRAMSLFPVSPRYAKMLVSGQQYGCLPYVIASVAVLAVGDPFLREEALGKEDEDEDGSADVAPSPELSLIRSDAVRAKEEKRLKRKAFFDTQAVYNTLGNGASDLFRMLAVVGAYEYDGTGEKFCVKNYVRPKAMQEIHKLRAQMSTIASSTLRVPVSSNDAPLFSPKLAPPNTTQLKILRQLITSAFIDQIAVRKDLVDPSSSTAGARFQSTRGVAYRAMGADAEDVYIHPSSVMFHGEPPEWLVFQDLVRTSKVWVKTVTKLNPAWLPSLSPSQFITFSKPLETPKTAAQAKLVGSKEGETRETFVVPRFNFSAFTSGGGGGDGKGVELPPMKRTEVWKGGKWTLLKK